LSSFEEDLRMISRCFIALLISFLSCEVYGEASLRRVIDTFSTCVTVNKCVPCGWYSSQSNVKMISIVNENGNCFVKIKSQGGNTSIGIKAGYDALLYPMLSWRWRVHKLPIGAAENVRKRSDSAAGVYVIFHGALRLNKIIKYVWSASLQKGIVAESPFNPNVKIIVLKSGDGNNLLGQWVDEIVNVQRDYEMIFKGKPPVVEAVAILTDADNTESTAEADYDDFWISAIK
jgi:hypothetical protein